MCAALALWMLAASASAADVVADVELASAATSNVFMDASRSWDVALRPLVGLGLDLDPFWSLGYSAEANIFAVHPELFSHWHQLHLYANPAWGEEGGDELLVEASVDTLRNTEAFAVLNHVRPRLQSRLSMEPATWWRWQIGVDLSYRWFYDDPASDSFDAWAQAQLGLTLPSRTTLIPFARYGFRFYPRQDRQATEDDTDQQIEAGLRLGQGLWESGGLQLYYGYRHAIGASGLLLRKLTAEQFAYLGEEFFYTGHSAGIGFKQLLGESWNLSLGLNVEQRSYGGWQALDAEGRVSGEERSDLRLTPQVGAGLAVAPPATAARWVPLWGLELQASYTRQWSNSAWYDTEAVLLALRLFAAW